MNLKELREQIDMCNNSKCGQCELESEASCIAGGMTRMARDLVLNVIDEHVEDDNRDKESHEKEIEEKDEHIVRLEKELEEYRSSAFILHGQALKITEEKNQDNLCEVFRGQMESITKAMYDRVVRGDMCSYSVTGGTVTLTVSSVPQWHAVDP